MVAPKAPLKNSNASHKIMLKNIHGVRDSFMNYFFELTKFLFSVSCLPVPKINNPIRNVLSFNMFII